MDGNDKNKNNKLNSKLVRIILNDEQEKKLNFLVSKGVFNKKSDIVRFVVQSHIWLSNGINKKNNKKNID